MKMQEYRFLDVDKSNWDRGEWDSEPDKVQFEVVTNNGRKFPGLALRNRVGAWCGYVGLPPQHPFYRRYYDDVSQQDGDYIEVHGGLTFSGFSYGKPEEMSISHLPEPGESGDVWWVGFDCSHAGDLSPQMTSLKRVIPNWPSHLSNFPHDETYRNLDYTQQQVVLLAEQLSVYQPVGLYQRFARFFVTKFLWVKRRMHMKYIMWKFRRDRTLTTV